MKARRARAAGCVAGAAVLIGTIGAAPAGAHQSPPGCDSNSLTLTVTKDRTLVRNGDRSNYTVAVANNEGSACDLTSVTVSLTLPAADGTPRGEVVTLASNVDYPAGTAPRVLGTVPWTVALNAGVTDAVTQAKANGVLHDAPTDHAAEIVKTLGTTVTQPHLTVTQTATPDSGTAPLGVTYTYVVTNDSSTPVPIANPVVTDDRCASPVYSSGDGNGNGLLDNGEAWTYTCTQTFGTPGGVTSTAGASGTSTVDNLPVVATPVSTSVTVALPPRSVVLRHRLPPPSSQRARPDASCLALIKRVRLRARERNVIRVRVQEGGQGVERALVRIRGAGIVRRAVTDASGKAVFRIRPKRSGRLVIQTDRCSGADRVKVRGARKVISRQVPRVTG
jgi:hypothetical protein